ncbi:unnamed protein product [Sphagnum balticum]
MSIVRNLNTFKMGSVVDLFEGVSIWLMLALVTTTLIRNKVFYNLGPDLIIMVTNPNIVKEILLDVGNYHKARPSTFVLSKLVEKSLLTTNGEDWVNHRQIFALTFRVEALKVLSNPNH